MKWCSRCVLPDSRPGIDIDPEGVCSACRGHEDKRSGIDWAERAKAFDRIVEEAKERSSGYDCVVPVSGGKDSWYQAMTCKDRGLKVLAVTWRTPGRTEVGQRNLENLVRNVGVDHVDYTIDPDVERCFMRAAYERKGATAIPMHMALFAIPIRLAVALDIPLIVWGENPQLEFGGDRETRLATHLDREWLCRFSVTNATDADDWVGAEGLTASDLAAYRLPDEEAFRDGPASVFLGAFFPWDSEANMRAAAARGFEFGDQARTGVWAFADIDCDFISLHHFLKWHKFGITRSFDNLSVDIRHGRVERDEAIERLRQEGLQIPHEDIAAFCEFVDRPESWFWETAERFRNPDVWVRRDGRWEIEDFLIPGWQW